jgi:uncharacterized membrane protein YfcA
MQFLGMSLKVASLYSLLAVVLASLLNFYAQKSFTHYKTGIIIIISSAIGSYLTVPYKSALSSVWIITILSVVSLYALYSVWFPLKITAGSEQKPIEKNCLSILVGLILGALTTFTGLGGGVVMLPVFLSLYHFRQPNAVATSLFAVGLSSLSSLIIQIYKGANFTFSTGFIFLLTGILAAVFLLKIITKKLKVDQMTQIRQIVFSVVVVLALVKVLQS